MTNLEFKMCKYEKCHKIFYRKYETDSTWKGKKYCSYRCEKRNRVETQEKSATMTALRRSAEREEAILANRYDSNMYKNRVD